VGPAPATGSAPPAGRPGIFHGWWVASAAFVAAFGSVVFYNPAVLGVFSTSFEAEFGWKRADVALAVSLGSLVSAGVAPLAGIAVDRWGGRWVIALAAAGMAACALLLSGVEALWQFVALYTAGRALATGAMHPAAFVAVANWFVRRRLFVGGIVSMAPRLGAAFLPLLATAVIAASGSWRTGWVALALVAAVAGLPALLLMHRRPEDRGLLPDGDPAPAAGATPTPSAERAFTLREAVRTPAYWLVGAGTTLMVFVGPSINFHQIPHLMDRGLPGPQAALIVTVGSMIGALGGVLGGAIAARITMRWTAVGSLLGMSGGVLLLLTSSSLVTAALFATVYGVSFGSQLAINQMVYAEYFGRRSVGLIRSSFQPAQLTMSAAGPYVVGLWFTWAGDYTAPFVGLSVLLVLAAVVFAFARAPRGA
jgi:MFS family permease